MIDADKLQAEFTERHNILVTPLVQRESDAIYWTTRTKLEIDTALSNHADELNQVDPIWSLLLCMLERTFEYVQGAIVAYVTGSTAASEVISRTAIESAINLMFILIDNRNGSRFTEYLAQYFNKEKKEINMWLKLTYNMTDDAKQIHLSKAIDKRNSLTALEQYINKALLEISLPTTDKVANKTVTIKEKFQFLGLELDYQTVYAALCSQTHSDAEDLLNYFVFVSIGDQNLLDKVGLETINFSRLMVYFGVKYYIMAAGSYAIRFGLTDALEILNEGSNIISQIMEKIANNLHSTT
ncbi:MAG: DUF5677 domain-containing protein [Nostoc sp. ChiSLP02]|nr:DUF5677 domain-containing protein [Nostoc sp. DedSLP05]MDZ8103979.1 DUF5677 domain-containing protein [Nostoc sp. DedSLP01]MDZ8187199.1 DUF5677 domain-containing protein [Nostoc sp. ChiSLP02]